MKPRPCDLTAPPAIRLGQRIRELRIDAELSVAELARRIGSHGPIVCRIERGKHELSLPVLARIAAALELDLATVSVVLDETWAAGARREESAA